MFKCLGAGVLQWWECFCPTDVPRFPFLHLVPFVGQVCYLLLFLIRELSLRILQFSLSLKNQPPKIPIWPEIRGAQVRLSVATMLTATLVTVLGVEPLPLEQSFLSVCDNFLTSLWLLSSDFRFNWSIKLQQLWEAELTNSPLTATWIDWPFVKEATKQLSKRCQKISQTDQELCPSGTDGTTLSTAKKDKPWVVQRASNVRVCIDLFLTAGS